MKCAVLVLLLALVAAIMLRLSQGVLARRAAGAVEQQEESPEFIFIPRSKAKVLVDALQANAGGLVRGLQAMTKVLVDALQADAGMVTGDGIEDGIEGDPPQEEPRKKEEEEEEEPPPLEDEEDQKPAKDKDKDDKKPAKDKDKGKSKDDKGKGEDKRVGLHPLAASRPDDKGKDKDKGKGKDDKGVGTKRVGSRSPRRNTGSRESRPSNEPCFYSKTYRDEGCMLRANCRIWMRSKSASQKNRAVCPVCAKYFLEPDGAIAAPADYHSAV